MKRNIPTLSHAEIARLAGSTPVDVYYNLTRKCLSVKQKGRVIAHLAPDSVLHLSHVSFKVNERARQRVVATRKKTVHAVIRGLVGYQDLPRFLALDNIITPTYNPYRYTSFVNRLTEQPISAADALTIDNTRHMVAYNAR